MYDLTRTALKNLLSFGNRWGLEYRLDLPRYEFGAVARWACSRCGPVWREPGTVCTYRGSNWQPAEYEWECPECGSRDVGEWDDHSPVLRRTK